MSFDGVILELVRVARRAGLKASPAESLDAIQAASTVGLSDKRMLKTALAATLVKREEDLPTFDRVFEQFFRVDAGGRRGALDKLRAEGAAQEDIDALAQRIEAMQVAGGGGGLNALLEGGAELDERIQAAMQRAQVGRMVSPMQVGLYSMRTLDQLGAPEMQAQIDALREEDELDPSLIDTLAQQLDTLRRRVRSQVREDFARLNPDALAQSRQQRLERQALAALKLDEADDVQREVRRLGETLKDRMERMRRRARVGHLDVRRTVRASLKTACVPMAPVFRKKRKDRPKLIVLCDISDSVRAAARFLLVLVYAMQEAFARTRSFVFVRDMGEVTDLFDQHSIEEAIGKAFLGETVNVGASSDYGRSLGQFVEHHLDAIDRRTTVVILGDGRNNYLDPNFDALKRIGQRAARVVWLNPEPKSSWGFGDSEMERYATLVDFTASVRSLKELRDAVTRLSTLVNR